MAGAGGTPDVLPDGTLDDAQKEFFYKYGFIVLRGLIPTATLEGGQRGAAQLIAEAASAKDGGVGAAFHGLPEGHRLSWKACTEGSILRCFHSPRSSTVCEKFIGPHDLENQFKNKALGQYTFAPRFYKGSTDPRAKPPAGEVPHTLPAMASEAGVTPFQRTFLANATNLGMQFAPCPHGNWHIDGLDYHYLSGFAVLWGLALSDVPEGNMGNLLVYPGTHHVLAKVFAEKGPYWFFDSAKGEKQTEALPPLDTKPEAADGKPVQVCLKAGDVVLAHPWLAHGIGTNNTAQPRLAVYARLRSVDRLYWARRKAMSGGRIPIGWHQYKGPWTGSMWACIPAMEDWVKGRAVEAGVKSVALGTGAAGESEATTPETKTVHAKGTSSIGNGKLWPMRYHGWPERDHIFFVYPRDKALPNAHKWDTYDADEFCSNHKTVGMHGTVVTVHKCLGHE
jgi:hypothetical protein